MAKLSEYKFLRFKLTAAKKWVAWVAVKNHADKDGRRIQGQILHRTESYRRKNQCVRELRKEGLFS